MHVEELAQIYSFTAAAKVEAATTTTNESTLRRMQI